VPEYAGGHHEKMDGKGYPNGLTREEMSIQARVMAIADIFEALTASDRPYKSGKKLSQALAILEKMKDDQHVDPDLYSAFIEHKVYLSYAKRFLAPNQIDVD
jgi:HD-GYP domain-containing protein (c-di-GMP phosphodiesterase class II)